MLLPSLYWGCTECAEAGKRTSGALQGAGGQWAGEFRRGVRTLRTWRL